MYPSLYNLTGEKILYGEHHIPYGSLSEDNHTPFLDGIILISDDTYN